MSHSKVSSDPPHPRSFGVDWWHRLVTPRSRFLHTHSNPDQRPNETAGLPEQSLFDCVALARQRTNHSRSTPRVRISRSFRIIERDSDVDQTQTLARADQGVSTPTRRYLGRGFALGHCKRHHRPPSLVIVRYHRTISPFASSTYHPRPHHGFLHVFTRG